MARKILLHVGYAKTASTSLQKALAASPSIFYPTAGRLNDHEHLSLPLKLKGIDTWTSQYVDEAWVENQHAAMMKEIAGAAERIAISSERLMDLTPAQMEACRALFDGYEIEIVTITRSLRSWLNSTWRHAVYWHDFTVPWEDFEASNSGFSMDAAPDAFAKHFTTRRVSMEEADWVDRLCGIYGAPLTIARENEGIPFAAAQALQDLHIKVGTERFQSFFTHQRKREFVKMFEGEQPGPLAPLAAQLF